VRARPGSYPAIADGRSGEVVFLSHCLLNQNTRYPGGAVCPGVVTSAITPYLDSGTGIVQMPCPEQRTWGGVPKRWLLRAVEHPRLARAGLPLMGVARGYLRLRYARLARVVARDIEDYLTSGFSVRGVVGVAGSPSCGVRTTLDLDQAADRLTRCPAAGFTAAWMDEQVVQPSMRPGQGMFVEAVERELRRRGLDVAVLEERLSRK
jgi:predicted secreted protein